MIIYKTIDVPVDMDIELTDDDAGEDTKRISEMVYDYRAKIEVELYEFSHMEIVEHITEHRNLFLDDKQVVGAVMNNFDLEINSLDDQIKLDHFIEVMNDYTPTEIENLIPKK